MTGIYRITNPNGRVYIGQSVNIKKRFQCYNRLDCDGQVKLHNSLKKYKPENHLFEIIEECDVEDLNNKERYWQDYYNASSRYNLNCRLTKSSDKSGRFKKSKEAIEKAAESNRGKKRSKEFCEYIKKKMEGRIISDEWKENIRKSKLGNSYRSKKVINIDTGEIYDSVKNASEILKINLSTLTNKLNGNDRNNTNLKYLQDV